MSVLSRTTTATEAIDLFQLSNQVIDKTKKKKKKM